MTVFSTARRPAQPRRQGRFVPLVSHDLAGLFEQVREIAEAVVEEYGLQVKRGVAPWRVLEPTKLTRDQWNAMRATWPGAPPTAKEVQRRVSRAWRRQVPWREILEFAFRGDVDVELAHARTAQAARDADLGPEHVEFALSLVSRKLNRRDFVARHYATAIEDLISADNEEARLYRGNLAALLPTLGQVETIFGSFTAALRHFGFEQGEAVRRDGKAGVPVDEAIARFYKVTGQLPRLNWLTQFARDKGFALGRPTRGAGWESDLDRGCALIAGLGWPTPPAFDAKAPKPGWDKSPWIEEGDRQYRPADYWTKHRCYEAVREFLELVGDKHPSPHRYEQIRIEGRHDWPSVATLQDKLGPFSRVRAETRQQGVVARAALDEIVLPEDLELQERRRRERMSTSQQAKQILEVLERAEKTLSTKEIGDALGWPASTVLNWLDPLWKTGRVDQHGVGRKNARWSIADRFQSPEIKPRVLSENKLDWPQAMTLQRLLEEHGPLAPSEIAAHTGWSLSKVKDWARLLCKAGIAATDRDGKNRRYRLAAQAPRQPHEESQAQHLLQLLRERGRPLAPKDVMAALGWKAHKTVKRWGDVLVAAGLARRGGSSAAVTYEAIEPGTAVSGEVAELKASETAQGRQLVTLLATHGPLPPKALLEQTGWRAHQTLQRWLDQLAEEGIVAVDGAGKKRVWRLVSQATALPHEEPLTQELLALLRERGEPMSPAQILEALEWRSYKTVKERAAVLIDSGLVETSGAKSSLRYWAAGTDKPELKVA